MANFAFKALADHYQEVGNPTQAQIYHDLSEWADIYATKNAVAWAFSTLIKHYESSTSHAEIQRRNNLLEASMILDLSQEEILETDMRDAVWSWGLIGDMLSAIQNTDSGCCGGLLVIKHHKSAGTWFAEGIILKESLPSDYYSSSKTLDIIYAGVQRARFWGYDPYGPWTVEVTLQNPEDHYRPTQFEITHDPFDQHLQARKTCRFKVTWPNREIYTNI